MVVNGFRAIRRDSKVLDSVFQNLGQDQLQALKDFITKTPVDFSINYPRTDLKVPSIVLLLRNEGEAQSFLGDQMGTAPYYDMPETDMSYEQDEGFVLGGGIPTDLRGPARRIAGPLRVDSATDSRITIDDGFVAELEEIIESEDPIPSSYVEVIQGTGQGKRKPLLHLGSSFLDIEGTFDPQLDSTSVVVVREAANHNTIGEPSRIYNRDAKNLVRLGANYDVQYQLQVIAGSQEEVLYLWSILKAIVFLHRTFLEEQGIMALKLGGSDFAPRSDYVPDAYFQRVLTLQFTYPFYLITEFEVAESIQLSVDPRDPNTNEFGVRLTTTITL